MGHRLTRIFTRTGDTGTTGLGDGSRVAKDNPRIEAIGAVDELNSQVGVLLAETLAEPVAKHLTEIQHDLFDLGGELSIPGHHVLSEAHVSRLESVIESLNADLPPLKEFILPGGSRTAALCHVARTVCRRAERRVVSLSTSGQISPLPQRYLNRLSDLLFVICRVLNRAAGREDVYWNRTRGGG